MPGHTLDRCPGLEREDIRVCVAYARNSSGRPPGHDLRGWTVSVLVDPCAVHRFAIQTKTAYS